MIEEKSDRSEWPGSALWSQLAPNISFEKTSAGRVRASDAFWLSDASNHAK
jgi:hypothetical protein